MQLRMLTLIGLVLMNRTFAQSQNQFKQIIPPSPNAANMAERINVPMSLYTGRQNISISIYNITDGDIVMPITLDYSSGGIKVSEIASSCGLGWNLNAGGMISRATMGWPDETPIAGYWHSIYKPWINYTEQERHNLGSGVIDGQPDEFYYNFPGGSGRFLFDKAKKPVLIPRKNYKFNYDPVTTFTSAYTGPAEFIPGWEMVDDKGFKYSFRVYEKGDMLPYTIIDGDEAPSTSSKQTLNTWYLTDILSPNGNQISFEYETVLLSYDLPPSKTLYCKIQGGGTEPVSIKEKQRMIINTKKIKRVFFSNGTVEFQYSAVSRPDLIGDKALEKILIKNKNGDIVKQYALGYKCLDGVNLNPISQYSMVGENNYFNPQQTFTPSAPMNRRLILESITEQNFNNVNLGKGYTFEYIHDIGLPNRGSESTDFWGFFNGTTIPGEFVALIPPGGPISGQPFNWYLTGKDPSFNHAKQGTLCKISYPEGGSTVFDYEANSVKTVLPNMPPIVMPNVEVSASFSFSHSLYGKPIYEADGPSYSWKKDGLGRDVKHYYVEFTVSNTGNYEIVLNNMPYYPSAGIYAYLKNMGDTLTTPWSSNVNGTYHVDLIGGIYRLYLAPSLDLANQPTNSNYNTLYGISISGLHTYSIYSIPPGASSREVGGIRVKQILTIDSTSSKSLIKSYSYDQNGEGSGHLLGIPFFEYPKRIVTASGTAYYSVFNYNSYYPLTTTVGGYVGYYFVSETSKDPEGMSLGRTDYTFINPALEPDFVFSPATDATGFTYPPKLLPDPPIENRDWLRGQLLRQTSYDHTGNILTEVVNEYDRFIDTSGIYGFKVTNAVEDKTGGPQNYFYTAFDYKTGHFFLKRKTETQYSLGSNVRKVFDYVESSKSLSPVRQTITQSSQDSIILYITYPKEYASGNSLIDSLVNKNIVQPAIETVQSRKSVGGVEQIVNGTLNTYYASGKGLVKSIEALKIQTPVALSGFKFSNAPVGQIPDLNNQSAYMIDSKYENKIQYNRYDDRGNLLEQQKANDVKEVYLWGYRSQYPVVKILGSDLSTVLNIPSLDTALLNNGSDLQRQNQLSLIRNHFSTNPLVQVSTYTYKPLVGITSETDPTGRTIYYEYDSFNRLKLQKDEQGNILKKYCYNYAGQLIDCN